VQGVSWRLGAADVLVRVLEVLGLWSDFRSLYDKYVFAISSFLGLTQAELS
jgi:hypothetical protein